MTSGTICFVGAGSMGLPMIARLVGAGREVRVATRSERARDAVEEVGALAFADAVEAAGGAQSCVLCVFSADQARDVLFGRGVLGAIGPGGVVVNHTTVDVATIDELAIAAAAHGHALVDAPVSGTPDAIARGGLTVLLGGEEKAVAQAAELVSSYASPVLETGGIGSATRLKLINNALFAAHSQLAEQALRIGDALGIDRTALIDILTACSGSSGSLAHLGSEGRSDFGGVVRYLRKDVAALRHSMSSTVTLGVLGETITRGPLDLGVMP